MTVQVPHGRSGDFSPSSLEKGTRTEQAVNLALAKRYVQGSSTRRVIQGQQRRLGPAIALSSAQVSRAAAPRDEGLRAWRARPLSETPSRFWEARYAKVHLEGRLVDCMVLIAGGMEASGTSRVRDCEIVTSAAEGNWRRFLERLLARGRIGVTFTSADDPAGLQAARRSACACPHADRAVLPSVPWQRCQFHLQQNAGRFGTLQEASEAVVAQLQAIVNAPDRAEAERLMRTPLES